MPEPPSWLVPLLIGFLLGLVVMLALASYAQHHRSHPEL